ncbi:MAG: cysteine desulfurase [Flavobacteriales bacterium]|nr:cysteine desulfurase [Flavobacteriales bacterium]
MMTNISYDIENIRKQFPVLHQQVNNRQLVYLDNAATTQKPLSVIEALDIFYKTTNANIHRGAHYLANKATVQFEGTREKIRSFINAKETAEIIFTSGTTDSINLVAQTWGRKNITTGDEILLSMMEHHSNIVPWQMLAEEKGAVIKVIPVTESGEWQIDAIDSLLNERTKLVAVNHVSNSLGTINPIKMLIDKAHSYGAKVLIDAAQSVSHFATDVQELDCDFMCFSGHKIYGPTGTGVLYGKYDLLEAMPPWRGGGEMISSVSFEKTTYNSLPHKFEAGTPHIAGVIALSSAIDFMNEFQWDDLIDHEKNILAYATSKISHIEGLRIFGTSTEKTGVISFDVEGIHPYDIGTLLDKQGIAVRTGHHCTEPLWSYYGVTGSVRASFAIYTTTEEIDLFVDALHKSISMLR